jgi:hypothetical protein
MKIKQGGADVLFFFVEAEADNTGKHLPAHRQLAQKNVRVAGFFGMQVCRGQTL